MAQSIKIVLDRIMRHPMLQNLNFETAVDYTVDFIRIIGLRSVFDEKTAIIDIKNYRAELPCDFCDIIQIRKISKCSSKTMNYSTDNFHYTELKPMFKRYNDNTYKIQGNIIYVKFEEGKIEISYNSISTDKDGYPKIPDNPAFLRALESYIKVQYFTILFDSGKINAQVYSNAKRDYDWNVAVCGSEMTKLSLDEMESISNSFNRLLWNRNTHSTGFKTDSYKEIYKKH